MNGERVITAIHGLFYGFKTISNVVVPSIQLLYDIFLAGIRSPINLIMGVLLLGLSHLQRLFGDMQKKVFAQDSNCSNAEGPPPGPEFKKNPKTDTVPQKKGDDLNGFLPTHPTTYSYNSSSIPTKMAQAFVKKTPTPLLIMAVPVQSKVPAVHETPRRSLFRSILRTVCLCLTIFALAPISQFDKSSALNILGNIQQNEVFKNLKFKYHAVCASTAQLLDNWLRKTKGTNDLAAIPEANQDRAYSERYKPQPRPGCPFFKKSNIR